MDRSALQTKNETTTGRSGQGPVPRSGSPASSAQGDAASYSRFVSAMKLLLPITALILIALVLIWPQLKGTDSRFKIGFSGIEAREAEGLNMVNARYMGTDNKNQPFSITADIARNLVPDATVVELEMPKADMSLEDGSWLVLTANTGAYNQPEKTLSLNGAVNLFHDSGYEIRTSSAEIDLGKNLASGKEPVAGQGPFGELRAQGFVLRNNGSIISFTGKSHLILYPGLQGR